MPTPLPHLRPLPRHPAERRRVLAGLLIAATLLGSGANPAAHAASEFDLTQLTVLLAQVKAGEATFTETRHVKMLDKTLESSGRLSFEAPDTFVRETIKPRSDRVAVVGNRVTLSQGTRSRTVALDSVREASVIIEAIRGTLTGNREALERSFTARVSGNPQRWSLELVPREPYLREQVASVRVSGERAVVREVQVAMFDGDRSVMTIEPVASTGTSPSSASATASATSNTAASAAR